MEIWERKGKGDWRIGGELRRGEEDLCRGGKEGERVEEEGESERESNCEFAFVG